LKLVFDQGSNRVSTDDRYKRGFSAKNTESDGRICRRSAHEDFLTSRYSFRIRGRELIDGVDEIDGRQSHEDAACHE
jgi:hypothetical protein